MGLLHFHSEFTKQLACHSISVELMKHFSKHLKMFGTTVESQSRPEFLITIPHCLKITQNVAFDFL